jgi:hypothetical protein
MKNRKFQLILIFLLLALFGCQPAESQSPTSLPTQASVQNDPYMDPYLDSQAINEEPTLVPYVFRTSKAGTVTVHGTLFVMDPVLASPDPNDAIFLVPLPEGEGVTMMPNFEIGNVPQADVDERTGEFVFTDIEPGQYVVMVYTNGNAKLPARNETGGFVIINIKEENRDQTIEVEYLQIP